MEKSACTVGMAMTEKQGVECQSESNRCQANVRWFLSIRWAQMVLFRTNERPFFDPS